MIDEIFGEGGTQLRFAAPPPSAGKVRFGPLAATLRRQARIAIGLRRGDLGGELVLAPTDDVEVDFTRGDTVVILDMNAAEAPPSG